MDIKKDRIYGNAVDESIKSTINEKEVINLIRSNAIAIIKEGNSITTVFNNVGKPVRTIASKSAQGALYMSHIAPKKHYVIV